MSNLTLVEYPDFDLKIEAEIQSIPIRIYKMDNTPIGVALVNSSEIGEAVVKLLYIDSTERHRFKDIHKCMKEMSSVWGFTKRTHQRRKDGEFHTVTKEVKSTEK